MQNKVELLKKLSNKNNIISAIALDQRGSLKKMLTSSLGRNPKAQDISEFKKIISQELTSYASAFLTDPQYGLPASKVRDKNCGLLLAYDVSGYNTSGPGHLPRLLEDWSVKRLKEAGSQATKVMLYYDCDEDPEINKKKHAFIERIGDESRQENLPFFLELVTYDVNISGTKNRDFAKVRPHKVNGVIKEFSKPQYNVDVLKVEVPVDMNYVQGYSQDNSPIYTKQEAKQDFIKQSKATRGLPFIFLSGGVSASMFQETLKLAHQAGSTFNGVLCGRATWRDAVGIFAKKGERTARKWTKTEGKNNILSLNKVLAQTATPWTDKLKIPVN